jgi:[ribosomal protein S5]-alanine N-acetyltransferase
MEKTLKCTLRPWNESYLDNLVKFAGNYLVAKNMSDAFPHPYTRKDGEKFIAMALQVQPPRLFAIDVNGQAVGSIGFFPQTDIHAKNAEMGYWLAQEYWGQGIMVEAVEQLVNYAFENFDITRIFARPFGTNRASQRVLEKSGFTLETCFKKALFKHGEFIDEMIYARRKKGF